MSHATEDKERFVVPFATRLRSLGLDIWLDKWEMLPGDSLVQRIFTEGIGQAAAIIVVLSPTSVQKRWVTEELSAAVIRRIEDDTRLIPIVLDGMAPADLPVAIRHLLYEPVPDVENFEPAVQRVVRTIFGAPEKPELGSPPGYAETVATGVEGLDRIDTLMLKQAGDEAVRDFGDTFNTANFLVSVTDSLGISETEFLESLEVLNTDGYITIAKTIGQGLPSVRQFTLTDYGIEVYATTFVENYDLMTATVVSRLAGWETDQGTDADLAEKTEFPRLLVRHILHRLRDARLLKLLEPNGPWIHFFDLSPKLRRMVT